MAAWTFPSNSGHDELICTPLRVSAADPELLPCDLVATARTIDTHAEKVRRSQHLNVSSILLSGARLDSLQEALATWIGA